MLRQIILCILLLISCFAKSQSEKDIETIALYKQVINSNAHDSLKVKALREWNSLIYLSNPQLDFELNLQIDSICQQNLTKESSPQENLFFTKSRASAVNIIGVNYFYAANYDEAITYYNLSYTLNKQLENLSGQANALNNAGVVYARQNNFDKALTYYNRALQLRVEAKDTVGISGSYRNISTVYQNKGHYFKAIQLLNDENKLNVLIKDSVSIATSLIELGSINFDLQNYETTKSYFQRATSILLKKNAKRELSRVYNGLGACFEKTNQLDSALFYFDLSIELAMAIENDYSLAIAILNKGTIFAQKGDNIKAEEFMQSAFKISQEIGDLTGYINALEALAELAFSKGETLKAEAMSKEILLAIDSIEIKLDVKMRANELMSDISTKLNKPAEALIYYKKYIDFKDSIINNKNNRLLLQKEFETQIQSDSIKNAEYIKVKDAQLSAQKTENAIEKQRIYYLIGGLLIVAIFGLFILNRYRITRRQNAYIRKQKTQADFQKEQIQVAHEEIKASITYAKRIQTAILPSNKIVKTYFPQSFIFYAPKDVVAGDFYWMEPCSDSNDANGQLNIMFAVADCTGHGVPGAMVSVVCNGALNRAVREFNLEEPAKILDKAREIVVQEFGKSEADVKDGMDIALCTIKGFELQYSGAYNPLWIIRNGHLIEIKANKQPIGKFHAPHPFKNHTIQLEKGDVIYIFSDGYADQFGGEKGKKFKTKALRQLLLSIQELSMEAQQKEIIRVFEAWKGDLEQIDDVCFMGVQV